MKKRQKKKALSKSANMNKPISIKLMLEFPTTDCYDLIVKKCHTTEIISRI